MRSRNYELVYKTISTEHGEYWAAATHNSSYSTDVRGRVGGNCPLPLLWWRHLWSRSSVVSGNTSTWRSRVTLANLEASSIISCCWGFTSWQHLRSHQDGYWFVTMCTHSDFTVLPHWATGPPAPATDIPLNHIILTLSQPVLALS